MRVIIGSDHAGFDMKKELTERLEREGVQVIDCGAFQADPVDYPDIAEAVAMEVLRQQLPGILICGTGVGIAIAANKIPGIRAAVCLTTDMARLAREHNDANVIAMGARLIDVELAYEIVKTFNNSAFQAGRHLQRVEKIHRLEKKCRERS